MGLVLTRPLSEAMGGLFELIRSEVGLGSVLKDGHAMNEEKTRSAQSGFADFLSKPIDLDALIEMIKTHSQHHLKNA